MSFFNIGRGLADASYELASEKVITFVMSYNLELGAQSTNIKVPFSGNVVKIDATCATAGLEDVLFDIEKSQDMKSWIKVNSIPIRIEKGNYFTSEDMLMRSLRIEKNDVLRVDVIQTGNVENVTLNVTIKIT